MCLSLDKSLSVTNRELAEELAGLFAQASKLHRLAPEGVHTDPLGLISKVETATEDLFDLYQSQGEIPPEFDYEDRKILEPLLDILHVSRNDEVRNFFNSRTPLIYDGGRTVEIRKSGYFVPSRGKRLNCIENYPEGNPDNDNSRLQDLGRYSDDHRPQ